MTSPNPSRRAFNGLLLAAGGLALSAGAFAQADAWPSRPITLVVPFAAGGGSDAAGREMASRLSAALGQPVVVDNRPGAGGISASTYVLGNKPDGYTLLLNTSSKVVLKAMNPTVRYDPIKDFTSIALFAKLPMVVVVPASRNIKDFAGLVSYLKTKPDASWGSPGVGTAPHFAGVTLTHGLQADAAHVAYKGSSPMHQDLLPGRLTFAVDSYSAIKAHIGSGAVVPLAVVGHQRMAALPNVPTLAEVGQKQFGEVLYDGWNVIDVHHETPKAIVQRLSQEIGKILEDKDMNERMQRLDMPMFPRYSLEELQTFMKTNEQRLSPLAARLKP